MNDNLHLYILKYNPNDKAISKQNYPNFWGILISLCLTHLLFNL